MALPVLPPEPPQAIEALRTLAWDRAPAEFVAVGLNHPKPAVRREAARLLGQLDTSPDPWLVPLLGSYDPSLREAAARSLALTPGPAEPLLAAWTALPHDARTLARDEVGPALLDGLGRRGDGTVVATLAAALDLPASHAVPAAHALGRLGRRKVAGVEAAIPALSRCASAAPARAPDPARACAWALARIGLQTSDDATRTALDQAARDRGEAWLVRALGTAGEPPSWAFDHADREVRVASLTGPSVPTGRIIAALADPDPWVADQAVLAATSRPLAEVEPPLRQVLARAEDTRGATLATALVGLGAVPSASDAADPRPAVAGAWFAAAPTEAWLELLATLPAPQPGPATPLERKLVGMISALEAPDEVRLADPLLPALIQALHRSPHPWARAASPALAARLGLVDPLAGALTDPAPEVVFAALQAVADADAHPDWEHRVLGLVVAQASHPLPHVRAAAARALQRHDLPVPSLDHRPRDDRKPASPGRRPTTVLVTTTRGELILRLEPDIAPAAVQAFLEFAPQQTDHVFHRVVPAFVVQTGDPTGTGWGGPGFTLPDEDSLRPFVAGAVGFAKSVPDDAGSQWFITTVDQPHLTGDYTRFGRLIRGLDVARSIEPGDRILKVQAR
jgi:cyclophilin family peptidyl-prolyl cis-trans isomerase